MAVVINNPSPQASESDNGMGFFLGVILLITFVVLFFLYILPAIIRNLNMPSISIPNRIDVHVQPQK